MDRLFGILPVRKSELVIGRYVFVLAMGLLSLIISLIAQPLVLKVLGEIIEFPIAGILERRSKVTKKPATGIYINTRPLIEPYL